MNDIMVFGLRRMSIGLGDLYSQGQGISVTYALDDYVIVDLFNFNYDLLQSFCSVCKNFLFANFINENKVFPFQKKKKKKVSPTIRY